MREHCIRLLHDVDALEIVGTGGDHANSFNISTTAALVTAAGGVAVAKHGNRAASSKCGAADVLEALGVNITISPERSAQLLKEINICFLFAQNYHIAMKYVAPVRRELGIRTVFNILGPLSNPAGAKRELMGVYDETLVEPLAHVMSRLGVSRGMVVFGQDSLDEISMRARRRSARFATAGSSPTSLRPSVRLRALLEVRARRRHTRRERGDNARDTLRRGTAGRSAALSASTPGPRSTSAARPTALKLASAQRRR